jgi:hypothetical protein
LSLLNADGFTDFLLRQTVRVHQSFQSLGFLDR